MKRIFLAIKIIPNAKLNDLLQHLRTNLFSDSIKWVNPGNMHLTIKFFGETEDEKIEQINAFVESVVAKINPFVFDLSNLGVFGSSYQPKIIWLGINHNTELTNLADTVLNDLNTIGIERDRQNFVPHLTLGRIKGISDKDRFQQIISQYNIPDIQTVSVHEIYLYESILQKEGPVYNIIKTYHLKRQN